MRTCPFVEGSAPPLITHRIGVDVCMARQRTFFHKCHRCVYRGQPAAWEPEVAPLVMLDVHAGGQPHAVETGVREEPRPDAGRRAHEPRAAAVDRAPVEAAS